MSCDKLVFDLSQEVEGSPNVFVRKDWLNILDNQNQNYQSNQSIIDTSQLANSNKYMSYREAYLSVPLLLSVSTPLAQAGETYTPGDYVGGLKNWFGQMIHSLTLDYNGTTIIQQTNFCNMWNTFKLLTTLSCDDIKTQGPTLGFYPDTSGSWAYYATASANGRGVCNNDMRVVETTTQNFDLNNYDQLGYDTRASPSYGGNAGATYRTKWIAYNSLGGTTLSGGVPAQSYATVGISAVGLQQIWKSYISRTVDATDAIRGLKQYSIMATIYLKHIHSFFNMIPLLKGVFMKFTLNLNNGSATIGYTSAADETPLIGAATSSNVPIGGVQPILFPSARTGSRYLTNSTAGSRVTAAGNIFYDLTVGATCNNANITGAGAGLNSKSVYLYVPTYTFNNPFEDAYRSNPVKQIKYTDIYQYQVKNIEANSQFSNLITNGIANIRSILVIPFYSFDADGTTAYQEWQSPYDTAGCGTTAPMVSLGNFNVQISGQNAIYNNQRYTFEEWNNQLYGQNAVNGGMTDGLTSGLLNFMDFQNSYCYYYVNVERMLPVEQSVPKSVQIIGTNYSPRTINLWVFVEYGVQVSIDILTGARV